MKMDMELIGKVAFILLLVGGINLGLMGLIDVDLISAILGRFLARLIFIIVGASAGFVIYQKYFPKKA